MKKSYRPPTENFPLGYWRPVPIDISIGLSGGVYEHTIETPSGRKIYKTWRYPQRVMYLSESKGKPTSNYWDDVATNKEGKKEPLAIFGKNIFDTPKPTRLIEKNFKTYHR